MNINEKCLMEGQDSLCKRSYFSLSPPGTPIPQTVSDEPQIVDCVLHDCSRKQKLTNNYVE